MSDKKKNRLSIYNLFGKAPSPEPSAKPQKRKSRPTPYSKINRLSYVLPNDASLKKADYSSIPKLPKNDNKLNPSNRNLEVANKSSKSTSPSPSNNNNNLEISSTVTPPAKESLPLVNSNYNIDSSKENEIHSLGQIPNTPSKANNVGSTSSLSSSIYPNDSSSKNLSNSTLPDFARKSSSIYPESMFSPERRNTQKLGNLRSSQSVKRTDLLRKRKPPPTLSLNTESVSENVEPTSRIKTEENEILSDSSLKSSESEFSPLKLMPIISNSSEQNQHKNLLSSDTKLDPANNVMFAPSSMDYDPPKFQSPESNDLNTNNHKHSRTLSSIEEITSALETFQREQERSFLHNNDRMESINGQIEDHSSEIYNTSQTSDKLTFDHDESLNLESCEHEDYPENSEELLDDESMNKQTKHYDPEGMGGGGLFMKVKDLPSLETGESLPEYIEKLKCTKLNIPEDNKEDFSIELTKPKTLGSDYSSSFEIFYDVPESNSKSSQVTPVLSANQQFEEIARKNEETEDTTKEDLSTSVEGEGNAPTEVHSSAADEEGVNDETEGRVSLADVNLVRPVDEYSESSSRSREENSKTHFSTEKMVDHRESVSTETVDDEYGVENWKRYSTETDFFPNVEELKDDMSFSEVSKTSEDQVMITPTEEIAQRELDLDDEIENSFNEMKISDHCANGEAVHAERNGSINDLYPTYTRESDSVEADKDTSKSNNFHTYANFDRSPLLSLDASSSDDVEGDNEGFDSDALQFSPKTTEVPLYRHNSMLAKGVLAENKDITTSASSRFKGKGGLHVMNEDRVSPSVSGSLSFGSSEHKSETAISDDHYSGSYAHELEYSDRIVAPIPDFNSGTSSIDEESQDAVGDFDSEHNFEPILTYDRREDLQVAPIQHSQLTASTPPVPGATHKSKNRRPPPVYPSAGRRPRGLSESTANPELFKNGISKPAEFLDRDKVAEKNADFNEEKSSHDEVQSEGVIKKGEKCSYIETLRQKKGKTNIKSNPSPQILPISIKQNGTISHKKIPSQQLRMSNKGRAFRHGHVTVKPRTRLLASEIDDGELPDATLFHSSQKTKVPVHPDADVIAASERFTQLAKQNSRNNGDLGRINSVLSVRPHYGTGMTLFVANPDSDDE